MSADASDQREKIIGNDPDSNNAPLMNYQSESLRGVYFSFLKSAGVYPDTFMVNCLF